MSRLLRVELTRLRWRRAVLVLVVLAIALPVVLFAAVTFHSRPMSASDREALLAQPYVQRQVKSCEKHPANYALTDPASCEATVLGYQGSRTPLLADDELRTGSLIQVFTLLALLMLLAGTTFVGHDWNSGSMSNQLLFDPRRGRVWLAKALAVTGVAAVLSAAVLAAFWSGVYAVAHHRGLELAPGLLGDGFAQMGRSTVLVAGLALGGYALTMLLRSTVGTIGVAFAISVVGSLLIAVIGGDGGQRWQPSSNIAAFVTNDYVFYAGEGPCPGAGRHDIGTCSIEHHLSAAPAAAYLGVVLVLLVVASFFSFRRRDVP